MALISFHDISKAYGDRVVLRDATAAFGEKQKIAVIGRNGAGKSTLVRILLDLEESDGGEIARNRDLRTGYLAQHDPFQPDEKVLEFLQRHSGREAWECARVAGRFHLKNELLEKRIGDLPGGYQMRVKLVAMLLPEPNFLFLDEPTNYLDLNTLLLLERFLRGFTGAFLVVSHDREFLKRTTDHTLEVENGRVFLFPGGVEEYLAFKTEQLEQKVRFNENVEARRRELQDFVDRFKAKASKAAQARSKQKQLERLETIAIDNPLRTVRIMIPPVNVRPKSLALKVEGLAVGYGERRVADGIDLEILQGAKVAVLGENGQGKTTLLKTLAGEQPPLGGSFRWHGVKGGRVAYYAQHVYQAIPANQTVATALTYMATDSTPQEIRDMAGAFLFSGDDIDKSVAVLSGGERARLCLAGLLLSRAEVLLLDEPTNHLDFETVEALGQALKDYAGSVFFVSHDRTFVQMVASHIVEVAGGRVISFPGVYEEYVYRIESELARQENEAAPAPRAKSSVSPTATPAGQPAGRLDAATEGADAKTRYQLRKEWQAALNKARKAVTSCEAAQAALTRERDELLKRLAEQSGDFQREWTDRLAELTSQLEREETRWLELHDECADLETKLAE